MLNAGRNVLYSNACAITIWDYGKTSDVPNRKFNELKSEKTALQTIGSVKTLYKMKNDFIVTVNINAYLNVPLNKLVKIQDQKI